MEFYLFYLYEGNVHYINTRDLKRYENELKGSPLYEHAESIWSISKDRNITNSPSTNGIYLINRLFSFSNPEYNSHLYLNRFLVATEKAYELFMNDGYINTMGANPKYFYRGKHIPVKTFVAKQLIINSDFNKKSLKNAVDKNDKDAMELLRSQPSVWDKFWKKK